MKKYKVSFWFGVDVDQDGEPNRVVYLETDKTEKREIVGLALKEVGKYPRSYQVSVDETDYLASEYYVVEIINSEESHPKAWYNLRDGEMFVVYLNTKGNYVTCQHLGDTYTVGEVPQHYCRVITSFKH